MVWMVFGGSGGFLEGKVLPYAIVGWSDLLLLLPFCTQGRSGQCVATFSGFRADKGCGEELAEAILKEEIEK
jgi:hypothetical protein